MNWFRRSSPSPSSSTSPFHRFGSLRRNNKMSEEEQGAALYEAFRSHWTQALDVITYEETEQLAAEPTAEQVTTVFRHLDQMMLLLVTEVNAQNDLSIGPVLDGLFTENVLQRVTQWVASCSSGSGGANAEHCRRLLLRLYEGLLNQSQYCLLVHKPILLPMLTLLEECSRRTDQPHQPQPPDVEQLFVLLLNQICIKITDKENAPLLEFFFNPSTDEGGPPKFLVFTFLIPYLYHEDNTGQLARDALLLLLSVSANVDSVGQFIAEHSNFCPVLATGLSALYSALPRRLASRADDWHRITDDDIDNIAEIRSFYNALEFCNAVVQVGHEKVLERLLDFIYNGFLVSVLGAALHENSLEELISATAYLELFFRTATEPPLMRILLKFILTEQYDSVVLLDTLITRISSNSRLCIVSLALFETLLNLNSEDLLFDLVLKYLVPCTHIMVSQANNLAYVDYYGKCAQRFFSLIPNCCLTNITSRAGGDISSASSANSLNGGAGGGASETPGALAGPKTTTNGSGVNPVVAVEEVEPEVAMKSHDMVYLEYLKDAHRVISESASACACWRYLYDGKSPDPILFREDPPAPPHSAASSVVASSDASASDHEQSDSARSDDANVVSSAGRSGKNGRGAEAPSSSSAIVDDSSQKEGQPASAAVEGSSFKRQSSFRKSKTNRYYRVPKPAAAGGGGTIETVPELDLTLGGEDGEGELEDEEEGEETEEFDASADEGRAGGGGGGESLRATGAARHQQQGPHDSTTSSSGSTPRRQLTNQVLPVNYFKLAFDEESLYGGVSDSQEESDAGGVGGHQHYVLRGWSQIQDMHTFLEVLHRVRTSRTSSYEPVDAICAYIDNVYDGIVQTAPPSDAESGAGGGGENGMAVSKDSGVDVGDGGNLDRTQQDAVQQQQQVILFKSSFASPNIGPFLSVLLHKLDNMLQNSLFMNLHLTGVLARLACYPQVLITSFLLNYSLVFQPAVRSLQQVLTSLRSKVDNYACTVENFDTLLMRGRVFLLQRERRHETDQQRRRHSRSDTAAGSRSHSTAGGRRRVETGDTAAVIDAKQSRARHKNGRLGSLTHLFRYKLTGNSPSTAGDTNATNADVGGSVQSPAQRSYQYFRKSHSSDITLEAMKTKNVVYCAIVLEEFLKEMAAISHEHAVRRGAAASSASNNNQSATESQQQPTHPSN